MTSRLRPQEREEEAAQAPAPMPADERETMEWIFDSRDYAKAPKKPWFRHPPLPPRINSADFIHDDPDALRAAPLAEVANALLALAHGSRHSPYRSVREMAELIRRWVMEDQGRRLDLAVAIGIKRSGASLADLDARSHIEQHLVSLARQLPWAKMPVSVAADDLRARFARWEAGVWPRVCHLSKPPETLDETARVFFLIKKFGLHRSLPNEQTLRRKIQQDRFRR